MNNGPLPFSKAWLGCQRCGLCKDRLYVVLGHGNHNADVMIVGEGPGPEEDESGEPFVGRSGVLLNEFLDRIGWPRDTVFVDNVVACWPHKEEENGKHTTRKPTSAEIKACQWRLWETIYRVDPMIIVALGASALSGLTGVGTAISNARGEMYMMQVPGFYKKINYPVFPTFHPAFLLRKPNMSSLENLKKSSPVYQFWEDLVYARTIYEHMKTRYRGGK